LIPSRRSSLSAKYSILLASILSALGFILNTFFEIPIFLDYYFLIGLSTAWFALFFMRGWWPVVVSIPAALATIPLFGQPFSAILFFIQVFVVTWIYRNKMSDDAVESGHVVFLTILYALFVHGPLYFLAQYYISGLPFEIAKLVSIKAVLNSNICVLLAYLVFVVLKLLSGGRSKYKSNSVSVSGLVFLTSYGVISLVSLIVIISFSNYYKGGIVRMYYEGMKIQAASVYRVFKDADAEPDPFLNIDQLRHSLAPGIEFQISSNGNDIYSSDNDLFHRLKLFYESSEGEDEHVDKYPDLNILLPSNDGADLGRMVDSFYKLSAEFGPSVEGSSAVIQLVQNANTAVLDAMESFAGIVFSYLIIILSAAAFYSYWLSSRAQKEINTLFSASKSSSSGDYKADDNADLNSDDQTYSSSDSVLCYSPIREISRGVDIINRSFAEILESRDSIRVLNAIAQKQLTNAGTIQQSFLVKSSPKLDSVDLSLFMQPAYNAGGDWYDAFSVGDKLFLVIADVCDKGVPAALFMSVFRSLIRYDTVSRPRWDLTDQAVAEQMVNVITHVNDYMSCNHGDDVYFATVLFVVFDQKSGCMTYISAGHESPLIFTPDRACIQLDTTGPAVGIFQNSLYVAKSLFLQRGTTFVGFTDGVIDARNEADESFTTERLIDLCDHLLAASPDITSSEIMDRIKAELMSHIGTASQFDDITLASFVYK